MIAKACVRFYTKDRGEGVRMFEIPCHRHGDALFIVAQFIDAQDIDKTKTEQGFLTNDGIFLDRTDGMAHAILCGQLPPDSYQKCRELYSEDLW